MLTRVKMIEILEWNPIESTSIIIKKEDQCENHENEMKDIYVFELNFDKNNSIIIIIRNINVEIIEIEWEDIKYLNKTLIKIILVLLIMQLLWNWNEFNKNNPNIWIELCFK